MTNIEKEPATFVATTRTDLKDLASIALYLESRGEFGVTRSGILNIGIKMLGVIVQKQFPIGSYTEAVSTLIRLGYKDPREKNTKYFLALAKALEKEFSVKDHNEELQEIALKLTKEFNQKDTKQAVEIDRIKSHIAKMPQTLAEVDQKSAEDTKRLRKELAIPMVEAVEVEDTGE